MRRYLVLLLLILVPFQASWAAAAAYCQHEKETVTSHLGHHEHEHEAGNATNDEVPAGLAADQDCQYCHLGSVNPLFPQLPSFAPLAAAVVASSPIARFDSHIADGIERPNWLLAA